VFCAHCGASNDDTAFTCVQCGRILRAAAQPSAVLSPGGQTATVSNYLAPAILVTIFCCIPLGIPAIIYAAQVNTKLAAGDVAGATASSNNAKMWCWIAFGVGLLSIMAWVGLMFLGVLGQRKF
jgi:interferon-induced transmembrane protein